MAPSVPNLWPPDSFHRLLAAARTGEPNALGRLLDSFRLVLRRQAQRRLGSASAKSDRSDVVQDAYAEALEHFRDFQGTTPEALLAWLRAILYRKHADLVRREHAEKREVGRETNLDAMDRGDQPRQTVPSAGSDAMRRERTRRIEEVLERLPEEYARVIRLRFLE